MRCVHGLLGQAEVLQRELGELTAEALAALPDTLDLESFESHTPAVCCLPSHACNHLAALVCPAV